MFLKEKIKGKLNELKAEVKIFNSDLDTELRKNSYKEFCKANNLKKELKEFLDAESGSTPIEVKEEKETVNEENNINETDLKNEDTIVEEENINENKEEKENINEEIAKENNEPEQIQEEKLEDRKEEITMEEVESNSNFINKELLKDLLKERFNFEEVHYKTLLHTKVLYYNNKKTVNTLSLENDNTLVVAAKDKKSKKAKYVIYVMDEEKIVKEFHSKKMYKEYLKGDSNNNSSSTKKKKNK